jgi:hypothetical protein
MSADTATRPAEPGAGEKLINGEIHVWDIFENAWVTLEYWKWVNGRG